MKSLAWIRQRKAVALVGIVLVGGIAWQTRYKVVGLRGEDTQATMYVWDRWGQRMCTSGPGGRRCEAAPWERVWKHRQQVAVIDSAALQRSIVAELQPWMSREEVRQRLGEPRTRVTMGGGLERWTYYNYDNQGLVAARTVIIFGDDGKIAEVNDM